MSLVTYTFEDKTEKIKFQYAKEDEFLGLPFEHIRGGIYKVVNTVSMPVMQLKNLLNSYKEHMYVLCKRISDTEVEIVYATNTLWCDVCIGYAEDILYYLIEKGKGKDIARSKRDKYKRCTFEDNWVSYRPDGISEQHYVNEKECQEAINIEQSKKQVFVPVNRDMRPIGQRKYVNIEGFIGVLVEPNIYYFDVDRRYKGVKCCEITLNSCFEVPCAIIGYSTDFHPSFSVGVRYLGVGDVACHRLKNIVKGLESCYFYHEFSSTVITKSSAPTLTLQEFQEKRDKEKQEIYQFKRKLDRNIEKLIKKKEVEIIVDGTEEFTFKDIEISYTTIFGESIKAKHFDYAYILPLREGKQLYMFNVLKVENGVLRETEKSSVLVSLLTDLAITKKIILKNGIEYPTVVSVIKQSEEQIQQLKEKLIKACLVYNVD